MGSLVDLGKLPGGPDGFVDSAFDINSLGQVVGVSTGAVGIHAFLWQPTNSNANTGTLVDLGDFPGGLSHSYAYGINDRGQISGGSNAFLSAYGDSYYRSFLWQPTTPNGMSGSMTDIGDLPGGSPVSWGGNDINEAGQIVGRSWAENRDGPFVWTPNSLNGNVGTLLDLGFLPGTNGDFVANAINDFGQVVGNSGALPFYWDVSAGLVDLNDYLSPASGEGWVLREVYDINNAGQIVGYARHNGVDHGVLLTPIPEPCSLIPAMISIVLASTFWSRAGCILKGRSKLRLTPSPNP